MGRGLAGTMYAVPQSTTLVLRDPHCRMEGKGQGLRKAPPPVLKQKFLCSRIGASDIFISSVLCRNDYMSSTQAGFGYTLPVGEIVSLI